MARRRTNNGARHFASGGRQPLLAVPAVLAAVSLCAGQALAVPRAPASTTAPYGFNGTRRSPSSRPVLLWQTRGATLGHGR